MKILDRFTVSLLSFDILDNIKRKMEDIMSRILVVEDEIHINELIKRNLSLGGHQCESCYTGKDALTCLYKKEFDLIILDVMLPELSGFELIEKLDGIPVIFVTAKGELTDKLRGLSLGAEDYIVKPFEMLELIARVNVVLRRCSKKDEVFTLGTTKVNLTSHRVLVKEEEIQLTPQEFHLLEILIQNINIALSREKLLELAGDTTTKGRQKR